MRAIGFAQGQRGDLVIQTVVARAFKEMYPDSLLVLGMNKQYADMAPLFYQHRYFDSIHIYDAYDNWPNPKDRQYLLEAKYDFVFPAMPKRTNEATWWQTEHQCQNACTIYGIPAPEDYQCELNPWFKTYLEDMKGYVAFNYIGAFYAGYPNNKSYSPERAKQIVEHIKSKGYKVLVIGDPNEPELEGTERRKLSYVDSVKAMLSCKAFIGIDSGLTWAASAYSFPTLACYADSYYRKGHPTLADSITPAFAIQPINPNGRYLSGPTLDDISIDKVIKEIDTLLS